MSTTEQSGYAPELDEAGHFPSCITIGCAGSACANARTMRDYQRYLDWRNAPNAPAMPHAHDWESRAVASAAASLLNEGARDVALELIAATRRRP